MGKSPLSNLNFRRSRVDSSLKTPTERRREDEGKIKELCLITRGLRRKLIPFLMALVVSCGGRVDHNASSHDAKTKDSKEAIEERYFFVAFEGNKFSFQGTNPEAFVLKAFASTSPSQGTDPLFEVFLPSGNFIIEKTFTSQEVEALPPMVYWKAEKMNGDEITITNDPDKVGPGIIYGNESSPTSNIDK